MFPIPPGVHWSDVQAVAIPGTARPKVTQHSALRTQHLKKGPLPPTRRFVQFGPPGAKPIVVPQDKRPDDKRSDKVEPKPKRRPPASREPKATIDPKLRTAARELRDRWMERVNEEPALLQGAGKYEVRRQIASGTAPAPALPALPALPIAALPVAA